MKHPTSKTKTKTNKKITYRVGDIVKEANKVYIVSGTKGWVHRNGWISLSREIGSMSLLTNVDRISLVKRREKITKDWWKIFPEGEK